MRDNLPFGWIRPPFWDDSDDEQTTIVYYRRELLPEELPPSSELRITADSRYKLFINNVFVQTGPCKGDDHRRYVDTVRLRPYLREGVNVAAVEVLCVSRDAWNSNHSLFTAGLRGLYIEGIPADGWRCHIARTRRFPAEEEGFSPLHIHEEAVADPRADGWKAPAFDDSGWETARICPPEEIPPILRAENLRKRPIPPMRRTARRFRLPAEAVPPHSERQLTLDAGEEMTAFLRLKTAGGRAAVIELLYSECYVGDAGKQNRLDSENGRLEGYADHYTVGGLADEVFEPFWFRTFRFLRVTVRTADEPLILRALEYEETGYPLEVGSSVTTSDPTLGPIWDISLRTLRRCMHDTYMDCPYYEQLQYIMDTRSQALYTYAVAADDRLARQAIDDFRQSRRPDGLLNACYPNKNENVIPGFSIYFILMLHDHMMYFGDRALLRDCLPTAERILDYFHSHRTPAGLVDKLGGVNGQAALWSFIDWAAEWMPTSGMPDAGLYGPLTMESLLYVLGLQKAAEICEWLGEPDSAAAYRARARDVQNAIRKNCRSDAGMLTDGPGRHEISQHAQVFGVLTDTLTPEEGRANLLRTIKDPSITQCTVAMCFYLFRALEKTGLYAYTDRYWNTWRDMLRNGCTTCVEAADYARSECHAWGALALYELPSVILGVRPAAPGYEAIEVRPVPGVLTSASGTVRTPRGDIGVEWTKQNGEPVVRLSCAEGVKKIINIK